jgi:hypothetical protein
MRTGACVGLNTKAGSSAPRERTRARLYCAGSQWISKIDDDVALRPAAADQRLALGWRFHRFWPVTDSAADEPSLATVTYPGPECPPHRHIARLGKLEDALEGWAPVDIQAAPRKGHQLAHGGGPGRLVRWQAKCSDWRRFSICGRPLSGKGKRWGR